MEDQLQIVVFLVGGVVVLGLLIRSVVSTCRRSNQTKRAHLTDARRHFVRAATMVAEARAPKCSEGEARSLAGTALNEAEIAIELDPNDAAIYILKSLALEQLGKPAAAVKVLDTALSPLLTRSLSNNERADTLGKRAELLLGHGGGLQDALVDLQESVKLGTRNPRLYLMLGTCYEKTGANEKALEAFKQSLFLDPASPDAKAAIERNIALISSK